MGATGHPPSPPKPLGPSYSQADRKVGFFFANRLADRKVGFFFVWYEPQGSRSATSTEAPRHCQVAAQQCRQIARRTIGPGAQPDRELSHRNRRQAKLARRFDNAG